MPEITSYIKNQVRSLPRVVTSGVDSLLALPSCAQGAVDSVSDNISRLNQLGKRLEASDNCFQGWQGFMVSEPSPQNHEQARGPRPESPSSNPLGPHDSVSNPKAKQFLNNTFDLMEKSGNFSQYPEVRHMGQTLRNMNQKGQLLLDKTLDNTGTYFTFEKNVHMGNTFMNLAQEEDQRLYALTANAGLLAHEATHSHYGVTDEKPLRGKLSPPRVGLEAMRSIQDYYQSRGEKQKVGIVTLAIRDYIQGAQEDGFTASELEPRIINQPISRRVRP